MIGIFDSGAGGLSVWKELVKLKPQEPYIYISDTAFCPYGPKDPSLITERSKTIVNYLISKGVDIIVIACNTATAAAIKTLRENYSIPFIGMEPAIKPASKFTKSGVVGVLATKGTFKGSLYLETSEKYAKNIEVIEIVGEGLVEIVEQGEEKSEKARELVAKYISSMIEHGADTVVLGCTHYPFIAPIIKEIAKGKLKIINPAPAVAKRAIKILRETTADKKLQDSQFCENIIATTGDSTVILKKLTAEIIEELKQSGKFTDSDLQPIVNQKFINIKI